MPMRRKIIDDSDCDPPAPPSKRINAAGDGTAVLVVISSDDSDSGCSDSEAREATICEGTERPYPASASVKSRTSPQRSVAAAPADLNALQYAARFGRFPSPAECHAAREVNFNTPLVQNDEPEVDNGYLWNAVPPKSSQYLDLEAACMDETTSGSSACTDSEDELTPGFVDDFETEKENLSTDDVSLLQRFFPHTAK
jgi:hypothetical protein